MMIMDELITELPFKYIVEIPHLDDNQNSNNNNNIYIYIAQYPANTACSTRL